MADRNKLGQLQRTCNGIRRLHESRNQVISELSAEFEAVSREWQELTNNALHEEDLAIRRQMRAEQSQLVSRRDRLRHEINRRRQHLEELRNDFEINGCPALGSPL